MYNDLFLCRVGGWIKIRSNSTRPKTRTAAKIWAAKLKSCFEASKSRGPFLLNLIGSSLAFR